MVSKQAYRDAMARFGASVNVVTSDGPAGKCGFTASAVCSVTDQPPTLLVCINRSSRSHPKILGNQVLCVNALNPTQQELPSLFGSQLDGEAKFSTAPWEVLLTGAPALKDASVVFDCRVSQVTEIGTHSVLFCEVVAVREGDLEECLIYFGRDYHPVRKRVES